MQRALPPSEVMRHRIEEHVLPDRLLDCVLPRLAKSAYLLSQIVSDKGNPSGA